MSYVNEELRKIVASRAHNLCEYFLIHEEDTYSGCQVDHVISIKHGGSTIADNLACAFCNQHKGTDLGSVLTTTGELVRFFNPRHDHWADHFKLDGVVIKPLTHIGEVTVNILDFNNAECLAEREVLSLLGLYPPQAALALIAGRKD